MALFGKKKPDEQDSDANAAEAFTPQPEKARKWFDHAQTMTASSNFDYALTCFAMGLKFQPDEIPFLEQMFETAIKYLNAGGKASSGKELKQIDGPDPVDKMAAALFSWMKDLNNASTGMKALQAANKADQDEIGRWLAPRLLTMLKKQKKKSKSMFVQAKDAFSECGAWNEAFMAGEAAIELDPSDNNLVSELKQLTAQRAIAQGGYAEAAANNEEGGFRAFVKDMDKQRELEEEDSISGGTAEERNLARAKKEWEDNPKSPEAIKVYAQLVKKPGTLEAEESAWEIFMKGYDDLGEYQFRMLAGDIRIAQAHRAFKGVQVELETAPDDQGLVERSEILRKAWLELRSSEYTERADKYPTDRMIKYALGEVEFDLGNYENAMACFQGSKDEPRLRVKSSHLLGRCFAHAGWHQEAVGEYKEALGHIDATEKEMELPVRYDMMLSLIELAQSEQSVEHATDAGDICSAIVRKDIKYRDVAARRNQIQQIMKDLG
ncbi:MAG: hypothetical protein CMJ32_09080 [Phycisphaerae bacterium]|nr:hypothetical protein [Phycisphaerae bacterium]